jgi:hypothetical protein
VTNWVGWPQTFNVSASGACELGYRWKKGNTFLTDGGTLSGANSNSLTISALDTTDAGNYSVVITNGVGGITSTVAVLSVLTGPTNPIPIPGLVMHMPFDDSLTDVTGRGNNGVGKHTTGTTSWCSNSVLTTVSVSPDPANPNFFYVLDGKLGHALHYATDTGVPAEAGPPCAVGTNDFYVALGVRPDLKFGSNTDFSVSYWIRLPIGYDQGDLPFFDDVINSTFGTGFTFAPAYGSNALYGTTGNLQSGGWAWSLNGVGVYGDYASINDGNWHSLVHTYHRTGNGITYLDGVQVDSRSVAGQDISNGSQACVGQDPTGAYAESGAADIDDLGVWRRALTSVEARGIYVAATNGFSFEDLSLAVTPGSGTVTLTWQSFSGVLQQATVVTGPYTDVPGPPPSPYTVSTTGGQKFFRVRGK